VRGDPEVVQLLNEILTAELTGVNQYFLHAKMAANWGYDHLAEHVRAESIDEMKHAEQLVERILYLEGHPNLQRIGQVQTGETVHEQLRFDLELEKAAVERLNAGIAMCVAHGDNGTRELLEEILTSEEAHLDWLETQLSLIDQVGEAHYLAQQIRS
jgi:bacterioferritin